MGRVASLPLLPLPAHLPSLLGHRNISGRLGLGSDTLTSRHDGQGPGPSYRRQ